MTVRDNPSPIPDPASSADDVAGQDRLGDFIPAVIAICVGCMLSAGAFFAVVELNDREHQRRFDQVAEARFDQIEKRIDRTVSVLLAIAGFYAGSQEVTRDEFRAFVAALGKLQAVQALEWIPRVAQAQRATLEDAARKDGFPDFAFTERQSQGNMIRAAKRAEYFPVYFVEPYVGNETALGFDLSSDAARLEALNRARDSGELVATSRITLVQETGDQFGFLVFIPIYRNGAPKSTIGERRENLVGFSLGVFRIGDLAKETGGEFSSSQNQAAILIFDQSAPEGGRRLYPKALAPDSGVELTILRRNTRTLGVAGRKWLLVATPTASFIGEISHLWRPWVVLLAGLLFTGLLALYLKLVTGRTRKIELLVQERTADLIMANEELDAFAHSVSHDLRAPLRSLDGFSQALIEDHADKLEGEAKYFLGRISNASRRMGLMIDNILTLARASRLDILSQDVDLSELAQEILADLRKSNPDRSVTINIAPNIVARGDPRLLQIVLDNLLANAWKFTSKNADAKIEFGRHMQDHEEVYFVGDDGVGFDMTYADKLFGMFQRLHSVSEFDGAGVGLATVARLVRRHGGRVWAEGEVNKGASFYFTLGR